MEKEKGWINRQLAIVEREVSLWPQWMRDEIEAEASKATHRVDREITQSAKRGKTVQNQK